MSHRSNKTFNYAMRKAALTKEKDYALQNGDHEKASELDSQLLELEAKAEDAEKRRYEGGASSISAVSFINNRNRKNNVLKAELAIKEDIKRKEVEGEEDNPFTRQKCRPRMVTKKEEAAMATASSMTSELLKKMAEEQRRNKESKEKETERDAPKENVDNGAAAAADATDGGGEPAKKKAKTAAAAEGGGGGGSNGKEDLFSYHDFDIDIPGKCQIKVSTGRSIC